MPTCIVMRPVVAETIRDELVYHLGIKKHSRYVCRFPLLLLRLLMCQSLNQQRVDLLPHLQKAKVIFGLSEAAVFASLLRCSGSRGQNRFGLFDDFWYMHT